MSKRYCVIVNGYVENVLVADEEFAKTQSGWLASEEGQLDARYKDGLFYNRPYDADSFDDKANKWVCDPVKKAEMKAQQQEQVWEAIKQKRYDNLRQGVYVKSVGKWFQTDDATRLQYLTLRTLSDAAFPLKEPWKTMDNTYLPKEKCTKALFEEIVMQMVADETADFHNAERHRLAMLQAEDPLQYDFSKGWTANYFSTAPSALVAAEEEAEEETPKGKKPAKKGEE